MDKLQELLKEYQLSKGEWVRLAGPDVDVSEKEELVLEATILSKKYGFIKWLVENEKIDRVEVWSEGKTKPTYGYTTEPYTTCKSIELENTILMVLAIKDEPIEFLVSILK